MRAWRLAPAHTGVALDLVTVLSADDCLRCLLQEPQRLAGQHVCVRQEGGRVLVEVGWQHQGTDERPGLWLLRFEGALMPVSAGTHVYGPVVRNGTLEMLLAIPGLITASFAVLGIALAVPFVAALSVILLALFVAYYVTFQKLLNQQAHDLAQWIVARLTQPAHRVSGPLP